MITTLIVVVVVVAVGTVIFLQLKRMEAKMDQERKALDDLVTKLSDHFAAVDEALARILSLNSDPDVDNSDEIASIVAEVQTSTDKIRTALTPPVVDPEPTF